MRCSSARAEASICWTQEVSPHVCPADSLRRARNNDLHLNEQQSTAKWRTVTGRPSANECKPCRVRLTLVIQRRVLTSAERESDSTGRMSLKLAAMSGDE